MEGQKKGECGHIMASLDPHANCVRCRECNLASAPCAVCLAMTPEQHEAALLAHARRQRRIQRRKERAARDRASSVGSSSSKHSSGSVAVGDSLAVDRPTPGSPVAPAKGGGSTAADSAVTNSATPVPSLRRDGGQGPSVTPSTWVDDRGSASLRGQIDGEPASPRARVDGCSADSSPRRVESRGRVRHSRSRTPIERRHRSPSADRETAEPELILPYTGLDQDGLDTDRGCWLVPNRERVDRRVRSPSRGVAAGVVRTSAGVQGPVRGPGPAGTMVRDPGPARTVVRDPGPARTVVRDPDPARTMVRDPDPVRDPGVVRDPVRDPGVVRDPVRASRGVRAPAKAYVADRSRSRLRDRHSSSSGSSDSDDGRRTFQQEERGRRRRRSPHAASADHPLATVCNQLLQSMGALRADNVTMSERLGALERCGSIADPSPLPLTPHPREDEDAALEELSLEAPGASFSEEDLPRDWLPRDAEPMVSDVPRQHSDTSAVLTR